MSAGRVASPIHRVRATVHVVDPGRDGRLRLQLVLESQGYAACVYASGEEFLGALSSCSPGCLVARLDLPGIGGLELMTELRRRGVTLKVILLTGSEDVAQAVRAMRAGAHSVLKAPCVERVLVAAIDRALRSDEGSNSSAQ